MKKFYSSLIFLLLLTLGIISCNNDDQLEPDFISAEINEKNWNGIPEINVNNVNDTLTLLGSGNEQVVFFKIKYNGEGVYNLSGSQANFYTTVSGDVITSLYTLGENTSSQITITEHNLEQNILKGNFQISLIQKWSNPENNVNLLSFTNGQFKVTITE
ncbi:DUF6252 family protein [Spongiivirga citrea]|uniref:DUF4847 domain-containing protein n=1 Tax=Spongiivirga citrea TaxID=1481457 RepID=A0A6M0CHV9_9FLAO|nr:DUF6252 family protein [Spongiivirga citrea]NER17546.1 hypothetical protein [Spongiivirga citrea]